MYKKKILIVVGGIWIPAIDIAGTKCIYEFIKKISCSKNCEIHILTSLASWTSKDILKWFDMNEKKYNLKFHYIKADYFEKLPLINLIITRLHFLLKIFIIQRKNKFDIIHDYISNHYLFYLSFIYKKFLKLRVVYTLITSGNTFLNNNKLHLGKKYIDKILFLNKSQMYKFNAIYSGLENKTEFLPIGIDVHKVQNLPKNFLLRNELLKNRKKLILYVGPLEERKGIFTFAKACRKLNEENNDLLFVFVSYGKSGIDFYHKENKDKIIDLIGKNYLFLEGKQNIFELMKISDIFVLPLNSMYGTLSHPLVLLEAMFCECKCIVSDLDEIKGIIEDQRTGILFRANNSDDLVCKINRCLREKNNIIGKKAKEEIIERYNMENNVKRLLSIYNSL